MNAWCVYVLTFSRSVILILKILDDPKQFRLHFASPAVSYQNRFSSVESPRANRSRSSSLQRTSGDPTCLEDQTFPLSARAGGFHGRKDEKSLCYEIFELKWTSQPYWSMLEMPVWDNILMASSGQWPFWTSLWCTIFVPGLVRHLWSEGLKVRDLIPEVASDSTLAGLGRPAREVFRCSWLGSLLLLHTILPQW